MTQFVLKWLYQGVKVPHKNTTSFIKFEAQRTNLAKLQEDQALFFSQKYVPKHVAHQQKL